MLIEIPPNTLVNTEDISYVVLNGKKLTIRFKCSGNQLDWNCDSIEKAQARYTEFKEMLLKINGEK